MSDLSKANTIVGSLNILSYVQPTSDLYHTVHAEPAAVFSYRVTMKRVVDSSLAYPFVWRREGPIELQSYFESDREVGVYHK